MENKDSQQKREEELANAAQEEQLNNNDDNNNEGSLAPEVEEVNSEAVAAADTSDNESSAPVAAAKRGSSKAWIAISAILAIVLVIVLIKPPFAGMSNESVATVNGVKITKERLYDELAVANGAAALDSMITMELIEQAANKAGATATDEDIQGELDILIENFGTAEALDAAIAQNGMTMDLLKENIRTQVLVSKILEPQTTVTDELIKKFYDENKEALATPEQIRVSHILVGTKQEAEDIVKQLKDGADFAALAAEKSMDTNSKDKGGDLNFISKGQSGDEAFDTAAFALDVNEVSGVVETASGFDIIKKTEHKEATTPTLEEKKEMIRKQLLSQQVSELSQAWMEKLRKDAKITNTLEKAAVSEDTAAK
ncbi:MAG: peptidylprolyl isomerase [Candidatus Pristimantibacillus sp.]